MGFFVGNWFMMFISIEAIGEMTRSVFDFFGGSGVVLLLIKIPGQ
jgi:hypothetical protein